MDEKLLQITGIIALGGYIAIKEILVPLLRKFVFKNGCNKVAPAQDPLKLLLNTGNPNQMSLEAFCQHMLDFKENQEKWNEKHEDLLAKLDGRVDILQKN